MKSLLLICSCTILLSTLALAQSNPVPLTNNPLVPDSTAPGGASFTLTVNGTGFVSSSVVDWNGTALATNFVSTSQLTATVPAANIATASTATVTVVNPGPGGGNSNPQVLGVREPFSVIGFGKADSPAGEAPYSPIVADVNGDGNLDVLDLSGNAQTATYVSVLLGNGNGTFQQEVSYQVPAEPYQVVSADFNNDHNLDVATAGTEGLTLMLGNGDGTFQPYQVFSLSGEYAESLAAADFNGDGNQDLALLCYYPLYEVCVLLGNGDGTFQPPGDYELNSSSELGLIVTGDFNGDGKLDLAVPLQSENEVAILLGNGDGTFQNPLVYPTASLPVNVITADLNSDGKLDLAVQGLADLSVLLGNGDGTFKPHVDYPLDWVSSSMTAEDLNGDGILDLIATTKDGISAYFGKGDGTFPSSSFFVTGSSSGVAAGDFNNDGKIDAAVTDPLTNVAGVVLQSDLLLSPSSVDFGRVRPGRPVTATVNVSNMGSKTINVRKINITTQPSFSESNNCGSTISPGASCTITVTFTPQQGEGFFSATVHVTDSGVRGPQSVFLEARVR